MSIQVAALAATQHQQTSAALGAPDEWLGHDYDVETPVYLLVYPSSASYGSPAYSPWSIAWPVGGATEQRMTAWRHLQVDACTYLVDSDDPPCFGYQGPFTKTAGSSAARRLFLFNATLTTRQTIEQLAKRACSGSDYGPAAVLQDGSKEWVKGVLDSMVASGLMSGVKRDRVVQLASAGHEKFMTPCTALQADSLHCRHVKAVEDHRGHAAITYGPTLLVGIASGSHEAAIHPLQSLFPQHFPVFPGRTAQAGAMRCTSQGCGDASVVNV